jgi:putative sigma-54 modulation protein
MKVEFTGRHFEVTAPIKKQVKEHLEKIEKVFDFDTVGKAHVILETEKHRHIAEIVFRWRDQELTGKAETTNMDVSITQAVEKLEKQLLKLKGKKTAQRQKGTKLGTVAEVPPVTSEVAKNSEIDPEAAKTVRIVRSSRYAIKPLSPEDAAQEVSVSENQFLVFRDSETDKIAVIYKRKDGDYGLIEP